MYHSIERQPLANLTCPICGGPNGCAPAECGSFNVSCWCKSVVVNVDLLSNVPESQRGRACVCRNCITAATENNPGMKLKSEL